MLPRCEVTKELKRKVDRALVQLSIKRPFWASLILASKLVPSRHIPTAATDGKSIAYNPDFFETMDSEEIEFVLAHEALHKSFLHVTRRCNRDPEVWNWACDYIINDTLVREKFKMPTNSDDELVGLHDLSVANRDDSADSVYKKLMEDKPPRSGDDNSDNSGHLLQPGSIDGDDARTESELAEIEAQAKAELTQAVTIGKQAGELPAAVAKLVNELLAPKVDWRKQMREFLTQRIDDDVTWRRPNRRLMAAMDIYLPSVDGLGMGEIAVCIDTSGSIYSNQNLFDEFCSEVSAICEDLRPEKVTIVQCDSKVTRVDHLEGEFIAPEIIGGGGTKFEPAIRCALEEAEDELACIVYFTDLYGDTDFDDPGVPVLWAVYDSNLGQEAVRFGTVIKVED